MNEPDFNPYASPKTEMPYAPSGDAGGCYCEGKLLIVPRWSEPFFPTDTCVNCGQPAATQMKRNIYWQHPALLLLILLNVLVLIIVVLIVRKKMTLVIGVCERHLAQRRAWIWATWGLLLAAVALPLAALLMKVNSELPYMGGALLLLLCLIAACRINYFLIRPKRIDKIEGRFLGCGEAFLSQFPGS